MSKYRPGVQDPTETIDTHGGTEIEHPAFGAVQVSRVSGTVNLHGSDFSHHHFIALRINTASMKRNLSSDWHHPRKELIEVYMSEAQWAALVSSLNMGAGVPCTIQHVLHEQIPQLPRPKQTAAEFDREMKEHLNEIEQRLQGLLAGAKTVAQKQEIAGIITQVKSNVPFVATQFGKHIERTVHKAKMEVNAYATATAMGSEQLLPPLVESPEHGLPAIEMSEEFSSDPPDGDVQNPGDPE